MAASADAGPSSGLSLVIIGSSERTEPIAPGQSARRNGNSRRTLIAPAIGATGLADCLLPANWLRNCEYGPIFDLLTRFKGEPAPQRRVFGWTSYATSLHDVLNEEADSINSFRGFYALWRDRTRSVSVLAA